MKKTWLAVCLVLMMLFSACAKPQPADGSAEGAAPEQQTDDSAAMVIEVAGLELKYPQKWEGKVDVATEAHQATFSCGDSRLFDLYFNKTEVGDVLGTVCGDTNTVITYVLYPLEGDNAELVQMQEDVNYILDHLAEDYDFVSGAAEEVVEPDVFDIETSVVTLKYPLKWKDKVTIEVSDGKVCFSNEGTPLFDLVFSEGEGYLLGSYNGTPIYLVEYPVSTEEQIQMKDDVNVILDYLSMDEAFE